jgi:hypothetical protein
VGAARTPASDASFPEGSLSMLFFEKFELKPALKLPKRPSAAAFAKLLTLILQGALEITNGCRQITTSSIDLSTSMILISFIIAFSGLSIIGQVSSIIHSSGINIKKYFLSKICQGAFSSLICWGLINTNIFTLKTSSHASNFDFAQICLVLVLMMALILTTNTLGSLLKSRIKNRWNF